jgi:putative alpha-1,2-mannosidase
VELAIETEGFVEPSAEGPVQYVQSVVFNDEPLDRTWLAARELHRGGRLLITLGPEPSTWGTTTRPPSVSHAGAGFPSNSIAGLPANIAG